jgi:hypothetical protein
VITHPEPPQTRTFANEVAQSAAAAAEQMSLATEKLADMAQELLKMTTEFRIEDVDATDRQLPSPSVGSALLPSEQGLTS